MITKLTKTLLGVLAGSCMLSSCSSGNHLSMVSDEGVAKVKELVRANVDSTQNKIYRLEWQEDDRDRKLDNLLSTINISYIDKNNNDFLLTIHLEDGEFVVDEPIKSKRQLHAYEQSTPIDLNKIDAAYLQKVGTEADELFCTQNEEGDQYEVKSVERFCFRTDPVSLDRVDLWERDEEYRAEHQITKLTFELNYTKKGETPETKGRAVWTNYYTVPFVVNEQGEVTFDE